MDRTPYQLPFSVDRVPPWSCPRCRAGFLTLDAKSLISKETAASLREHEHPAWEPDWIRHVFSCVFECSNAKCNEPVSCCGVGQAEIVEYEDEEFGWGQTIQDRFTPEYFQPHLLLMDIPTTCPPGVCDHLFESFTLFFADPGASLNCARTAVEAVLTDLGIKRFVVVKNKRKPINLHQRILLLPPKHKEQVDLLLAVKWLGNSGSHDGEKPTAADVRITYDLLEHVLSEIYEEKGKKLKAVAKKVNKKKGPLK